MNHTATNPLTPAVAIIPARYNSTRLPGKPLLEIAGRPMILYVVERALAARNIDRAIVATDDRRVFDRVCAAGFEAVMTRAEHQSGSDRIAEAAAGLSEDCIVVNVQGDEPLISPGTIERAVDELRNNSETAVVTTSEAITDAADVLSHNVVKVVTDASSRALYFSRAPIPFPRDHINQHGSLADALERQPALLNLFRKHTGLYAYSKRFLLEYATWPVSQLEHVEALEQLRILERGLTIRVIEAHEPSIGVDTPEDLERVRKIIEEATNRK